MMNALQFAQHLGGTIVAMEAARHRALDRGGEIIETEAKRVIGTYDYGWELLAESTLARKSADTPLLETGEMRDSISHQVVGDSVQIGSDNQKAVWHELGTSRIPPRSFLMGAAMHVGKKAALTVAEGVLERLLGGSAGGYIGRAT